MEKLTYVAVLDKVIAGSPLSADEIEKVKALREQTAKRHAKSDKPSKAQREKASADDVLRQTIVDAMVVGKDYKTADLGAIVEKSTQYTVNLVKPLVADGTLVTDKVKGSTIYRLAVADAE